MSYRPHRSGECIVHREREDIAHSSGPRLCPVESQAQRPRSPPTAFTSHTSPRAACSSSSGGPVDRSSRNRSSVRLTCRIQVRLLVAPRGSAAKALAHAVSAHRDEGTKRSAAPARRASSSSGRARSCPRTASDPADIQVDVGVRQIELVEVGAEGLAGMPSSRRSPTDAAPWRLRASSRLRRKEPVVDDSGGSRPSPGSAIDGVEVRR